MHRLIQDLAYARFQYEQPQVEITPGELEVSALVGEVTRGGFLLEAVNGVPMRGLVCSSHPRMRCTASSFEGTKVSVGFEFDGAGLLEGDIVRGEFTVIYNGGERSLPFVVAATKFYPASSLGIIRNLDDFANLARASWEEAFRIFTAGFFRNIIGENREQESLLYQALGASKATMQGMEEFLVGSDRKQRIVFETEERLTILPQLVEDIKTTVTLRKEGWGYLEVQMASDSPWLVPLKEKITSGDFVGNQAEVEVLLLRDKLHGGKNTGRLVFESLHQRRVFTFEITCTKQEGHQEYLEEKRLLGKLTRLYLDFRLGKIVTGVWSKKSCDCLERLKELKPGNLWYLLYHAQALLVNKQRQEAGWLLSDFRRETVGKKSPLYAYYLYLCTLEEQDASFVARTFRKIQNIYHENQEDIRLFYIMLFLDPELLQSDSRKLAAIAEKMAAGRYSPILCLEAWNLMRGDVYLLKNAGDFERQVLYWAVREQVLTVSLAGRIPECMAQVRRFHPMWYRILKECYQINTCREMLTALLSFCIKWELLGAEQFPWYDAGVKEELRIAGLYEAWLDSASREQVLKFPRSVMIYFQYQNSRNFRKQALLYASIVRKKELHRSLYEAYRKNMEHFAFEQLLKGRVDENLAVLYEEFVKEQTTNQELYKAFLEISHICGLDIEDSHGACVVVAHPDGEVQRIPLVGGRAYISLKGERYCILAEDDKGLRYLPRQGFKLRRLFQQAAPKEASSQRTGTEEDGTKGQSLSRQLLEADDRIMESDGEAEAGLTDTCAWIFRQGTYTERILWYLCCHFQGSLKELAALWKAAQEFELDTLGLEERFLTQLLYTRGWQEGVEVIFLSCFRAGGRQMVLMAGLTYFSYRYFVEDSEVSPGIFECVERQLLYENPLNDCCRLAYLKWVTERKQRTAGQEELMEKLLGETTGRRMYFAFYQHLPGSLKRRYLLHDKVFLEYRTNPDRRVRLAYSLAKEEDGPPQPAFWGDAVHTCPRAEEGWEDMEQMYEGIFVKAFVVFEGEMVLWHIREEDQGQPVYTGEGRLRALESGEGESSRYGLLNQMGKFALGQEESLPLLYQEYKTIQTKAEELFRLL